MKRLMGYSFFMVGFGMFFMFIIPSDVIGIIIILILLLMHPRGAFLLYRKAISCKVKKGLSIRTVQIENAN